MKKKRNPSKHVFILANKTTSSTLFYLFFVFNEKNRAHIDIYYNFYNTFATSKQAKNKGIMKPIYSNLTCKMLALTLCSIMLAFLSIGCEHDVYNPDNGKDDEKTPNSFDFSTTSSIQVNVKYDVPEGYKVLFEIYLEDPFTIDKDGQIIKRTDLEPVIRRMTDGNGAYSGKEIINSDHGDEAYIYTSYIGVPTLFKTVIAGDAITADIKWDSTDDNPQTRAEGWQAPKGYHVLGTWSSKGYPHYLDTDNKITIPGDVLTIINTTLKEGGTCPKQYRQAIDFEINDPEGRNAEVSIRIIGGTSGAASAFGYYCYRADASLSEIKKAPKCIVFPNTLMDNYYNKKASGLQGGESVKLHYIDPDGVDQGTVFPNGVKIGWFLLNDSFYGGNNKPFYSTTKLNGDGRTHTAAFRIDDFVVLSFEDWTDQDYNDIQFNVWSNPIEAIINPDIPDIKPDGGNEDKKYSLEYKGIIAFEDNWPRKGDYDLNDVIVKYQSVLNFNDANQALSTEDTYELLWSGATFKNGFAYQLNTERSNMSTEILEAPTSFNGQGLDTDLSKATVNVFLSALDVTERNTKTATYKIKNTFKTPLSHETLGIPPYNPFIMVHDELKESRIEVHLVNYPPTEKGHGSIPYRRGFVLCTDKLLCSQWQLSFCHSSKWSHKLQYS